MRFERLVAINISDVGGYAAYRDGMRPILHRFGGAFGYDFVVSETLQPANFSATRVFTIHFPDESASEAFFADPEYQAVREKFFDTSVREARVLATYQRS